MSVISTPAALIGLFNLYASRGRNLLRDLRDEPGMPLTGSDILTLSGLVEKAKDLPDYAYWLNLVITALVGRNSYLQARLVLDRETPFLPVEHRAAKLLERLLVERDKEMAARSGSGSCGCLERALPKAGAAEDARSAEPQPPRKPQVLVATATSGQPYTAAWADPEARGGSAQPHPSAAKMAAVPKGTLDFVRACGSPCDARLDAQAPCATRIQSCGETRRSHQDRSHQAVRILANAAALPTAIASPTRV